MSPHPMNPAGFGGVYDPSEWQTELTDGRHPDCPICTEHAPYLEPAPGNITKPRRIREFELAPGMKAGWNLSLIFHGRKTRTPIGLMHMELESRARDRFEPRPELRDSQDHSFVQNVPGPVYLRSCNASGIEDWREKSRFYKILFGCIKKPSDQNLVPKIVVGMFLVIGNEAPGKLYHSTILLPIAHLTQHYVERV